MELAEWLEPGVAAALTAPVRLRSAEPVESAEPSEWMAWSTDSALSLTSVWIASTKPSEPPAEQL